MMYLPRIAVMKGKAGRTRRGIIDAIRDIFSDGFWKLRLLPDR